MNRRIHIDLNTIYNGVWEIVSNFWHLFTINETYVHIQSICLNRKRKYNSWIDISQPCYSLLYSFYQSEKCCSLQYIKCMMRKSIGIIVPHVESTHDVTKVINDLSLLDENSAATASQLITDNDMTPRNFHCSLKQKLSRLFLLSGETVIFSETNRRLNQFQKIVWRIRYRSDTVTFVVRFTNLL